MIESGDGHSRDSNQENRSRGPTDGVHLSKNQLLRTGGSKKDFPLVPSMRKMRWNGTSSYSGKICFAWTMPFGRRMTRAGYGQDHHLERSTKGSLFCHATGSVRAYAITTESSLTDMVRIQRCPHVFDRKLYR
jgi:hypothetical protein